MPIYRSGDVPSPGGPAQRLYTWQKSPLSRQAQEYARQTALIRQGRTDSGKVYRYRKLHDDPLDQGKTCCSNCIAGLTNPAGIEAQIGYKRRPGSSGGRPSAVIAYTLDRQFDVAQADRTLLQHGSVD